MKVKKAIILGAGFGKRMRPITKKIPKPLVKINGVTLLENSIKFLNSLGVKHIVVNAHHLHKEIVNFVKRKRFSSKVNVVVEKRKILDTGGGILNASKQFKKQSRSFITSCNHGEFSFENCREIAVLAFAKFVWRRRDKNVLSVTAVMDKLFF